MDMQTRHESLPPRHHSRSGTSLLGSANVNVVMPDPRDIDRAVGALGGATGVAILTFGLVWATQHRCPWHLFSGWIATCVLVWLLCPRVIRYLMQTVLQWVRHRGQSGGQAVKDRGHIAPLEEIPERIDILPDDPTEALRMLLRSHADRRLVIARGCMDFSIGWTLLTVAWVGLGLPLSVAMVLAWIFYAAIRWLLAPGLIRSWATDAKALASNSLDRLARRIGRR